MKTVTYALRWAAYRLHCSAWHDGLAKHRPLLPLPPPLHITVAGGIRTLEMHANQVVR